MATVCTAAPDSPVQTEYDRNCGFDTAREATYRRRQEDHRALDVLGAEHWHMGLVDDQYGGSTVADIGRSIDDVILNVSPSVILVPLGLLHPDHTKVAVAAQVLCNRSEAEWWLYEELPNRVLYPQVAANALLAWREGGYKSELGFLGTSDLDQKERAVRCYDSQLWALNMHAVLCPERVWRLWPSD